MARIIKFEHVNMTRNQVHESATCTYSVFDCGRDRYFQLDTYGSQKRKFRGKKSQSIQLDKASAKTLMKLLSEAF